LRTYSQPDYATCLERGKSGALFTQGWQRVPAQVGPEVNTQGNFPPRGDRAAALQAADLDAPWPPPT
jgi:hypothetical protein